MRRLPWLLPLFVLFVLGCMTCAQSSSGFRQNALDCNDRSGILCTEVYDSIGYGGAYTGHDESALLFYSDVPGSGNTGVYFLRLPKDPPTQPNQNGTGGTFNFQLHPTFWVGMALCDDQSAPNPGGSPGRPNIPCTPNSDNNIFDGSDPTLTDYIGSHPGTGFMEMQFYPPGWFSSCDNTNRWCSALLTFGLSQNLNTGSIGGCSGPGGSPVEYVNFAFITKSGMPGGPPSPQMQNGATFTPTTDTLFYNSGDLLRIDLHDTMNGLKITITDLTTNQSGSMTASSANGFASLKFDPTGATCTQTFHDFHTIYATSSEHTRVPWAAHSFNIAFSDELGHFEYCNAVNGSDGTCLVDGVHDLDSALDGAEDDNFCFDATTAGAVGFVPIGGCTDSDIDFDGVSYQLVWPGTFTNTTRDRSLHAEPVQFTSPLFKGTKGESRNYGRVAFEANLPRIEFDTNPPCQRHFSNPADPVPGKDCVNPPKGANFYPLFTTAQTEDENCIWQLGGAHIPGTTNTFGGSSTAEYGGLLNLAYPATGGMPTFRYNNFRNVLRNNPCRHDQDEGEGEDYNHDHAKFHDSASQPQNSSLSYQDPSQGMNLQSVDGVRSITHNGTCVSFAGDGVLNNNPGYLFTFEACDLSALGTSIGNFSVVVTGPLGFLYQKSAVLTSGYVLINPL
ncbi:MAG: hypothetical protein DMG69_09515 [Acidobacteria bacterium]|nr:MAG: hypothetical protein DMG69_09515 [Acidobacteriota bacterium]